MHVRYAVVILCFEDGLDLECNARDDISMDSTRIRWCCDGHHLRRDDVGRERRTLATNCTACGAQCKGRSVVCGDDAEPISDKVCAASHPCFAQGAAQCGIAWRQG